jgi:hypothetical protein
MVRPVVPAPHAIDTIAAGRARVGGPAVAQPTDGDHVQGAVGVAITAVVDAMPVAATAGDRERAGGAQGRREASLRSRSLVLAGGDEQGAGVETAMHRGRRGGGDELRELAVEDGGLGVEINHARASERCAASAACTGSCNRAWSGRSRSAPRRPRA